MKARWFMRCECCGAPIEVGSHYVMFHGRAWITKHAIEYQRKRRNLAASAEK